MIRFEFEYHVVFSYKNGIDAIMLKTNHLIKSGYNIFKLTEQLKKDLDLKEATIINWKLLSFRIRFDKYFNI